MKDYLKPLLKNNKAMFLAYDHGFEHGPKDLIGKSYDPNYILDLAVQGDFTGIILQKGIAEKYYTDAKYQRHIPLIIKINGKTNLRPNEEPYSPINCSVNYAKKLGAQAVGYTIYLGSEYENKSFEDFGKIQEEAHQLNMAAIAWIYPRGKAILKENDSEIIKYAARLGLELGADLIKIKYPDTENVLKDIVNLAGNTKVVLSGGEKESEEEFLTKVKQVMANGFSGVAVGRNIWQRPDALTIAEKLRKIIF
ncbi:MAG: fructose-bisphosphate aldolase [Parcubacteria group bacterium]|nr:fructose-bisphosphate aldolase [Parcubacteria group bacterium]